MLWLSRAGVALAAALVYANALGCGFAFDDQFAILTNGDVSDPNKPLAAVWGNDFWGQDIRGEGSHKSYRRVVGRPYDALSRRSACR